MRKMIRAVFFSFTPLAELIKEWKYNLGVKNIFLTFVKSESGA